MAMRFLYTEEKKELFDMPPLVKAEKCVGCGICIEICPLDVLKKEGNKAVVKYPDECWHCRACVMDCPNHAIEIRYPLSHMMLHMNAPNVAGRDSSCE